MIYDLLSILLILVIILTSIMVIKNLKHLLEDINLKPRRGRFIKKLEKDTEDLSVDVFLKEVKKY